jgi:hypothetical protein
MILAILAILLATALVHVVFKFCINPYRRRRHYLQYSGVVSMPFFPVVGAFKIV